jgi:rhodanese-related sulfurtransferase
MPSSTLRDITASELHGWLLGDEEIALLDVREARQFNAGHPNLARPAPLSMLELNITAFVPRRTTRVVLYDAQNAADGPAATAQEVLLRLGYTQVHRLAKGLAGWTGAGLPVTEGFNTLIKAFADLALQHYRTPALRASELLERQRTQRATTLIDVRPLAEYQFLSIASAHHVPGTELSLRQLPCADAQHLLAINCFSRTRGIIGATTLNLLGLGGNVAFLEDGVMAWSLAGGATVHNAPAHEKMPLAETQVLRQRADDLITRYALRRISPQAFVQARNNPQRNLYLFDLRQVAGGQLIMQYETWVGVRHARIVLADEPHQLRAAVTAFWLSQLNQADVFILDGELPAPMFRSPSPYARTRAVGPRMRPRQQWQHSECWSWKSGRARTTSRAICPERISQCAHHCRHCNRCWMPSRSCPCFSRPPMAPRRGWRRGTQPLAGQREHGTGCSAAHVPGSRLAMRSMPNTPHGNCSAPSKTTGAR